MSVIIDQSFVNISEFRSTHRAVAYLGYQILQSDSVSHIRLTLNKFEINRVWMNVVYKRVGEVLYRSRQA